MPRCHPAGLENSTQARPPCSAGPGAAKDSVQVSSYRPATNADKFGAAFLLLAGMNSCAGTRSGFAPSHITDLKQVLLPNTAWPKKTQYAQHRPARCGRHLLRSIQIGAETEAIKETPRRPPPARESVDPAGPLHCGFAACPRQSIP